MNTEEKIPLNVGKREFSAQFDLFKFEIKIQGGHGDMNKRLCVGEIIFPQEFKSISMV